MLFPFQGANPNIHREGVPKFCILTHPLKLCKSDKMQGAEMEDEGSVLKYMTKSEIEEQRSSLLIMIQCQLVYG